MTSHDPKIWGWPAAREELRVKVSAAVPDPVDVTPPDVGQHFDVPGTNCSDPDKAPGADFT